MKGEKPMAEEKRQYLFPDEEGGEHLFKEWYRYSSERTGKTYLFLEMIGNPDEGADDLIICEIDEYGEGEDDFELSLIDENDEQTWDELELALKERITDATE